MAGSRVSRRPWAPSCAWRPFDAPDGEPVSLLVFLLVPENATEEHLEILSELAELLSDPQIRESLMKQDNPAQIHKILATWKPFRPAA
jgi:PTS system nitrogen regulatory IIA component